MILCKRTVLMIVIVAVREIKSCIFNISKEIFLLDFNNSEILSTSEYCRNFKII